MKNATLASEAPPSSDWNLRARRTLGSSATSSFGILEMNTTHNSILIHLDRPYVLLQVENHVWFLFATPCSVGIVKTAVIRKLDRFAAGRAYSLVPPSLLYRIHDS